MASNNADDLVVALSHLGPVLAKLDAAPYYDTPEESAVLGLARVPVPDVGALADALASRCDAPAAVHGVPRPDEEQPAIDRVLWHLRARFAARHCGWTPELGKNRAVGWVPGMQNPDGSVGGAGEVSHGGGKPPRAVTGRPGWAADRRPVSPDGVQVGLVDTSMAGHDYLSGSWVGPHEIDKPVYAEQGHATFIAGLLRRYAPGVTIQVRPVLDMTARATTWDAAHRIVEAGRSGIDVLNLSFVSYTEDGQAPMVLAAALDQLDPDIVVVAAAGNHGYLHNGNEKKAAWPAAFPNVIAVGAASAADDGTPAEFSPAGAPWVDVLALGEDLESTFLAGDVQVWVDPDDDGPAAAERREVCFPSGFARWNGTSFAAALVSAMVARGTVPGRVPAREAWDRLYGSALAVHEGPGPVFLALPQT